MKDKVYFEFTPHKLIYHTEKIDRLIEGENVYPITATINLTNSCNLNCKWCCEAKYRSSNPSAILDYQLLKHTLEDMKQGGAKSVVFDGGGEPSLHPGITSLIKFCFRLGFKVGVSTNGFTLSEELIQACKAYCSFVRISLDCISDGMMKKVKRETGINTIFNNIYLLTGGRATIGVSFIVDKLNISEIKSAASFAKRAGCDYIQYKPKITKRWKLQYYPECFKLLTFIKNRYESNDFKVFLTRFPKNRNNQRDDLGLPCQAHRLIGVISADGSVHLCCSRKDNKDFMFGNLYEKSFKKIWEGKLRKSIINKIEKDRVFTARCPICRLDSFNKFIYLYKANKQNRHFI